LSPECRLLVADAHPLFALGVRTLLDGEPGIRILADTDRGDQALELIERMKPDIVLLDFMLEGFNGLEVLSRLSPKKLPTRTIITATDINQTELRLIVVRGARGVWLKESPPPLLVKCVRQVMAGEFWIGRNSVAELADALRQAAAPEAPAVSALSTREQEIVTAVIKGGSNKDIAWQLGVGEQTVKNHLRRIFAKRGVSNRVELAVSAATLPRGEVGS
jgi:DNA-binding NarL/FixJ family response regulator